MVAPVINPCLEIAKYYPDATKYALQHQFRPIIAEARRLRESGGGTSDIQSSALFLLSILRSTPRYFLSSALILFSPIHPHNHFTLRKDIG